MIDEQIRSYYACEVKNTSHGKAELIEDEGFGDSYNFIKEVLLLIAKDHSFLITILEATEDHSVIEKLVEPIVSILYENLIEGDEFHKDITKIIIGIHEEELSGRKLSWLRQKIQEHYLHRIEYRHYANAVVRNTLINICEDQAVFPIPKTES
jgi:hypothetical protein